MFLKRLAYLALASLLMLVLAVGCSRPTATPATHAPSPSKPAPATDTLTKATLPVEPGYAWDVARYPGGDPIPVQLSVSGPWTLTAGDAWPVSTTRIVAPKDVPKIDAFSGYDFVVQEEQSGQQVYFPRRVTDEWLLQLGKITGTGESAVAEPYSQPLKFWPLDFKVGDTFVVADGGSFRVDATVLAKNTATVPAGIIDNAYLLRFKYTPLAEGAIEGTSYYFLAPEVGFVALFHASSGDEATGFTALDSESVLLTLPAKR